MYFQGARYNSLLQINVESTHQELMWMKNVKQLKVHQKQSKNMNQF